MNKRIFIHSSAFTLVSLLLFQVFHANAQAQRKLTTDAPSFNFSYKISGDRVAAPLQAFDDGSKTYLQFRDVDALPLVFSESPAGRKLLKMGTDYDLEPPFVVVRKLEPDILLVMNKRKAFVTYNGPTKNAMVQTPAMFGSKQPVRVSTELPVPVAADSNAVATAGSRQSPQPKAAASLPAVKPAPAAASVPEATSLATPAAVVPAVAALVPKFLIVSGQPIHQALDEWAKSAGWTLIWYPSVSWKAISDVDMRDKKDVVAAVSDVITILREEGKPIRLRVSDGNNVMEVLSTEVKND